jgi:PadR family transcriptional regulator AphA
VSPRPTGLADPLLGEWACLGILYDEPAHGWAIATRLLPSSDIGRIWHIKRALTYRSLELLTRRAWIEPIGREPGAAGPNRTILRATRTGRARFRTWTRTPVPHLRDLRSELLLKLVLADLNDIDISAMLDHQRAIVDRHATALETDDDDTDDGTDVVRLWRLEATRAARRFIDQLRPDDTG